MTFIIEGKPQPKERPRSGKNGFYTPSKTKAYEERVKWAYKEAGGRLHNEAVRMSIVIERSVPKGTGKKNKFFMLNNRIKPTTRPDVDNCVKSIMDGLNGVAYPDDGYVTELTVKKCYGEIDKAIVEVNYA